MELFIYKELLRWLPLIYFLCSTYHHQAGLAQSVERVAFTANTVWDHHKAASSSLAFGFSFFFPSFFFFNTGTPYITMITWWFASGQKGRLYFHILFHFPQTFHYAVDWRCIFSCSLYAAGLTWMLALWCKLTLPTHYHCPKPYTSFTWWIPYEPSTFRKSRKRYGNRYHMGRVNLLFVSSMLITVLLRNALYGFGAAFVLYNLPPFTLFVGCQWYRLLICSVP